jgi:DNA polymerase I-like protein with 3'-5' exonuclease and polymerase domains
MNFYRIQSIEQALNLVNKMPDLIAIDTEFEKGDPRTTKLLSVIIADNDNAWFVEPKFLSVLTPTLKSRIGIFLQDYNHCDTIILYKNGCDLRETTCFNLIDMHHLIDENADHALGNRVMEAFGDSYKDEFWAKYDNYQDASEEEQLEYACKDAIYTYRLGIKDCTKINRHLYIHIRKLSSALLNTELEGLSVDTGLIVKTRDTMKLEIEELLIKLREEFDVLCTQWEFRKWSEEIEKRSTAKSRLSVERPTFSFKSDIQIRELLYGKDYLGLQVRRKTHKKAPSTDYEAITELAQSDERLQTLLRYKELKSHYNIFVNGILERVENDIIYPHFNVSGTTTGRLSHSDPNMGNIPREGVFRNFFTPSSGYVIIGADYTQLEVVIEANLTNDKNLIKIINEGVSKHDITAQGLGIDRNTAKTLNFALQYGAGVSKIRKILGIGEEQAEDIFKRYWELYSGVAKLKEKTKSEINDNGKITNLAGRTRHFPKTNNYWDKEKQYRQGYNFLIQGVAAECCNRAFYRIADSLKQSGNGRALFTVHDEIIIEVKDDPKIIAQSKLDLEQEMFFCAEDFNLKYPLNSKSYGPLYRWEKA